MAELDEWAEIAKRGQRAYCQLYNAPRMDAVIERLRAHGINEDRMDWFFSRLSDVFAEWEHLKEPEKKKQSRYNKIARLVEKLSEEIKEDEELRWSITLDDHELRRRGLEKSGCLIEAVNKGLAISPVDDPGIKRFAPLTLHSYLSGLADYLRKDGITPLDRGAYEKFSPTARALQFKTFAIKWCFSLLEALEEMGYIRKLDRTLAPNETVATIVTVLLGLEIPLKANDVTQARRNERRRYWED